MLIVGGNQSATGGYNVDNSLRFNDGSSDYLTRTPGSTTNRQTWTWSGWIKRASGLGVEQNIIHVYDGSADNRAKIVFQTNNTIGFDTGGTGSLGRIDTTQVFRDANAWYHCVFVMDTTNSTATDRQRIYVNGVRATTTVDVQVGINFNGGLINTTSAHEIGTFGAGAGGFFDGYMAEVVLIDGSALDPTSFGEFDEDSGIWKPISVSGLTFGTNGFYLDFEDSSALGADVSGNSNNFTVSNLTAIDQSTDTCTNNFATWNSLYGASNLSYAQGNTEISCAADGWFESGGTIGISTGKFYYEIKCTLGAGTYSSESIKFGIKNSEDINDGSGEVSQNNGNFYQSDGNSGNNGSLSGVGTFATFTTGDIVGCAVDMDNKKIYFHKNGTYINSGNPSSGSNGFTISSSFNFVLPTISMYESGTKGEVNFGSPPYAVSSGNSDGDGYGNFEYAVPSGYYALNTKNLAEYG